MRAMKATSADITDELIRRELDYLYSRKFVLDNAIRSLEEYIREDPGRAPCLKTA